MNILSLQSFRIEIPQNFNRYNHLLRLKEQQSCFCKVIYNEHGPVQIKSWNNSEISQESAIFWAAKRPKDRWHDTHSKKTSVHRGRASSTIIYLAYKKYPWYNNCLKITTKNKNSDNNLKITPLLKSQCKIVINCINCFVSLKDPGPKQYESYELYWKNRPLPIHKNQRALFSKHLRNILISPRRSRGEYSP